MRWIVIAACVALLLRYALDRAIRAGVERALRARSWGSEWAGGCFHVLQTNAPGVRGVVRRRRDRHASRALELFCVCVF